MAVNNIGVGSGLPLESMLTKLREVENVSLALVQSRYDNTNQRLSAYGKLKGVLEAFQNAAQAIAKPENLGAMKIHSSADAVTASASDKAMAGSYTVEVQQLARAQTLAATGQADDKAVIGASGAGGVITFTRQDGSVKTLDLSDQDVSLSSLVQAINADESLGISATLIHDGSANPHRLLLTARETGTLNGIAQISVSGNDALNDVMGFGLSDPASPAGTACRMQVQQDAQDAQLQINGIAVTSASNEIQNAIEGVSLSLQKTGSAMVAVTPDSEAASKRITAFVSAYNTLQGTINALTAYDADTKMGSALTGDTLARRVQSQMRATLNAVTDGKLGTLSRLGISTDANTGELKTDSAKLDAALKDNLPDVIALFAGESGIAARVARASDDFLRSDGMFATSDASIQQTLKSLRSEYESTERRIDDKIAAYRAQFVALDRSVAQMSSVSAYLSNQLSMLNNLAANGGSK